jgi:ParB family chromosome partitioning protein
MGSARRKTHRPVPGVVELSAAADCAGVRSDRDSAGKRGEWMLKEVKLQSIRVSQRTRKDMGDIAGLAKSIEEVGLLHPVVIDAKNNLIAGERRLRAVKKLGWDTVPAHVVDYLDEATSLLIAERDENTCRKEFTPSEAVVIGRRLTQLQKPKAEEKQKSGKGDDGSGGRGKKKNLMENCHKVSSTTRDKVGQAVGMSGKTYEKAKAVVESGDEEAIAEMDATGKVDPAFKKVTHVTNNSGENEWYTPVFYLDAARDVMGRIDVDPASCQLAQKFVQAETYYTAKDDGLEHEWSGNVWLNPPYSKDLVQRFIEALFEEVVAKRTKQAIVLVNNATETAWGQSLLQMSDAVCFPQGRISFVDKNGKASNKPLQGQMFCYIGKKVDKFVQVFEEFGTCLVRV